MRAKYDRGEAVFENQGGGGGQGQHFNAHSFFNQHFQQGGGGQRFQQGGGGQRFHVRYG